MSKIIKKSNHPVDIVLSVYHDYTDYFVAYSADDAKELQKQLWGTSEFEENKFFALDMFCVLDIMDEDHNHENTTKKTCNEWVVHNGRGFLCSTEF